MSPAPCLVVAEPPTLPTASAQLAQLEQLEAAMLRAPQAPLRFRHHFAPGIYGREMIAPAGTLVMGHEHRTPCLNVVLEGRARVLVEGTVREVKAGDVFVSPAGARKLGYVDEALRFLNVHPNPDDCADLAALEARHVRKSGACLEHERCSSLKGEASA